MITGKLTLGQVLILLALLALLGILATAFLWVLFNDTRPPNTVIPTIIPIATQPHSQLVLPPTWTPTGAATSTNTPPLAWPTPRPSRVPPTAVPLKYSGKSNDYMPPSSALPAGFFLEISETYDIEAYAAFANQEPVYNQNDNVYLVAISIFVFDSESLAIAGFDHITAPEYMQNYFLPISGSSESLSFGRIDYSFAGVDQSMFGRTRRQGATPQSPNWNNYVALRDANLVAIISTFSFAMNSNSELRSHHQTIEIGNMVIAYIQTQR